MSGAVSQVLKKEKAWRKPIWFMRQAGRYLPEYQALRAKHSMLELIRTPELAAQVTLQPLKRFDLDAAITFADILNPLIGMGVDLDFIEGVGPRIKNPARTLADIERLVVPEPQDNVAYTLEAQRIVRAELPTNVDLLGFAGAPFTSSCYLVEGGPLGDLENLLPLMRSSQPAWEILQGKLVKLISSYLAAQVRAGVQAVQLFDSWVGHLGPYEFGRFVAPYLTEILSSFRSQCDAPIIYFSTASAGLLPQIVKLGFDAVSVDWKVSLREVHKLAPDLVLQGNLDPHALFLPEDELIHRVNFCLDDSAKIPYHIFNLGHGFLPGTPIAGVEKVIELVRNNAR